MIQTKRSSLGDINKAASLSTTQVRRRRNWMRTMGNFLIVTGLLLMLCVGGYLGLQAYSNEQVAQKIAEQQEVTAGVDFLPPARPDDVTPAGGAAADQPRDEAAAADESSGASAEVETTPAESAEGAAEVQPETVAETQPRPAADTNKVVVDSKPLPVLNTGQSGVSYGGVKVTKPPVRVTIPIVGIDSAIVPVGWEMIPGKNGRQESRWQVAEFAVGHHQGSANPGQVGNVVLSGHVDWKGEVFRELYRVERGDQVRIYTEDREYLYIVQTTFKVKEEGPDVTDAMRRENARWMDPTPDQTLTMITCWPYGVDDHRLIVIAKPYDSGLPARPDLIMK